MSDSIKQNIESQGRLFSGKYLIISLSLSLIATGIVLYYTYTPDGIEHLKLKRMHGFAIALVVAFLRAWFTAAKIRYLANKTITWMGALRIVITWDFASAITPSTIGGAPLGIYAMTREGISLGQASAITFYALLLDQLFYLLMIPILLITGIYLEVIPENVGMIGKSAMFLIYALLLAYGFLLAYGVLINPKALSKMVRILFRLPVLKKHADKVEKEMDNLEEKSTDLRKKPFSFLLNAFILSSLAWLARVWLPTIVVLSFLPADILLSFLRSLAMLFAALFLPTPGGSGGMEGLFVLFQGPLMSREVFVGIATFVWRFLTFYMIIGIGVMVMSWYLNTAIVTNLSSDENNKDDSSGNDDSGSAINISVSGKVKDG